MARLEHYMMSFPEGVELKHRWQKEARAEVMDAIQAQIRMSTDKLDGPSEWKAGVWSLHSRLWHVIAEIRKSDRNKK